jgi:chromosome segregation ATPase
MDDDEAGGLTSGISGGAGYLLGRMAADRDRRMAEFTRRVFNPEPPRRKTYDAAEVHEVIDGWKASVRSKERTIEQWRAHSSALTTERDQLLARVAELEAHAAERQIELASLERAERGANAMLRDRTDQLEDLELAVARMSAQLADLQTENERLRQGGN